jgi:toxin secretion/phage lysis holin
MLFGQEHIDGLADPIFDFLSATPLFGVMLVLIFCDVVSGTLVAIAHRKLNSTTSIIGMTRKGFMVMFVAIGKILEPYAQGIPVAQLVACFYSASELLSIIENAGKLGVPIPKVLRDSLNKLRADAEVEIKIPEQTIHGTKPPVDPT